MHAAGEMQIVPFDVPADISGDSLAPMLAPHRGTVQHAFFIVRKYEKNDDICSMNKKFLRYDNPLWALLGAILFLLIFSWATSPLYMVYGGDCPFFEIIGMGILQGKVPYVDLFDHKGPLIFFVDALGFSFGLGKTGLWLLQVVWMTFTLIFFYKLATVFTASKRNAFFGVLLAMIPLIDFITEGNQCEEWMLPFIAASFWMGFRYILSGERKHPAWMSLIYGVSFAIVFYIRPNDAAMQLGGLFFGLFLLWIKRKHYEQLLPNIGAFIGGCVAVSIPVWLYFINRNAVPDLIYGMIIHNMRYTGDALFTWGGSGMIIIPALIIGVIMHLSAKHGKKDMWFVLIPILVFTVALIGKRDYYHYLIPSVPIIVVCFTMCLESRWKAFLWVVCVLFALFSYRQFWCIAKSVANREHYREMYSQIDELFRQVPENERNSIWNYNLFNFFEPEPGPPMASLLGAFVHSGITPGNAAFVYFQDDYMDEEESVVKACPKWLVLQPDDIYQQDFDWIFENYDLIYATSPDPVCEVRLYRYKY